MDDPEQGAAFPSPGTCAEVITLSRVAVPNPKPLSASGNTSNGPDRTVQTRSFESASVRIFPSPESFSHGTRRAISETFLSVGIS